MASTHSRCSSSVLLPYLRYSVPMPTPARSATAEIGAAAPWAVKTSRAASSTTRSLRRASACRPRLDCGLSERNVTGPA